MKNILLVATGSVAIEKFIKIVNLLKTNYELKIIASDYARKHFHNWGEIELETEEKNLNTFPLHIQHAKWADQIIVVPATANTIAKFNAGIADNQILSTLLAARQPILFIPAMNTYMYNALLERSIIRRLSNLGHFFLGPIVGMLKENEIGLGRMIEPIDICKTIDNLLNNHKKKSILISSCASKIHIDPIRYITNGATGMFALYISNELKLLGHNVSILNISNKTNEEVLNIIKNKKIDVYISNGAFADFDIKNYHPNKIRKGSINNIAIKDNIDVLVEVAKLNIDIYGFKLDNKKEKAIKKMNDLNLKGIIWNKIPAISQNKISGSIILKEKEINFSNMEKYEVAKLIAKEI